MNHGSRLIAALSLFLLSNSTTWAETLRVADAARLQEALLASRGGETILIEGGDYGPLQLTSWMGEVAYSREVTLRSTDPSDPAVFTALALQGVENLTMQNLVFDYRFSPKDAEWHMPFRVSESRQITVRDSLFDGDLRRGAGNETDGLAFGTGLEVRDSQQITIENNEFHTFQIGLVLRQSADMQVIGNDIHDLRHDGIQVAQVEGLLIAENYIHDFFGRSDWKDHRDMIQVWTDRTSAPSRDLVIRANVLNSGHGQYTQSIFMRNEAVDSQNGGDAMFYKNITIEDNVIVNAHIHGITVGEAEGLIIANNTLIRNRRSEGPDFSDELATPRINVDSAARHVRIESNVTGGVSGAQGQPDWTIKNNAMIQDRSRLKPGFYDTVFANALLGDPHELSSYAYRPNGQLANRGLGAKKLQIGSGGDRQ